MEFKPNSNLNVSYEDEFKFAEEFYQKAIEGLEPNEYPPKPDDWLDDYESYRSKWEFLKLELMMEEDPEQKEQIKQFLACTLAIYVDFMCALSYKLEAEMSSDDDKESIETFKMSPERRDKVSLETPVSSDSDFNLPINEFEEIIL